MALVAVAVAEFESWSGASGAFKFALRFVHPIALTIDVAYLVAYVSRLASLRASQGLPLGLPGVILAGPLPRHLFSLGGDRKVIKR